MNTTQSNSDIGKMKFSEVFPYLDIIAKSNGLNLKSPRHFKLARLILINLYERGSI